MSRNERDTPEARRPRRGRFDLFFFEYDREGDRYRLRLTRYAIVLAVLLPLLVILLLVVFFLARPPVPKPPFDIKIDIPPAETPTPRPGISPTPLPPRTAPTVRRGPSSANTHAASTPSPRGNTND